MPEHVTLSEQDLADLLSLRAGKQVLVEEVDDFLHEEFPYEQRIGIHDVSACDRCRKETIPR